MSSDDGETEPGDEPDGDRDDESPPTDARGDASTGDEDAVDESDGAETTVAGGDDDETADYGDDGDERSQSYEGDDAVGSGERTGTGDGPEASRRDSGRGETPPPGGPETDASDAAVSEEIADLRAELREFRDDVEDRTLHRDDVEADLREYVRSELRRGHARGWGPYVVLLYGTVMTVGAFYYEGGLTAILAMIVIWLSTLGLYVAMIVVGIGLEMVSLPTRAIQRVRDR